MADCGHSAHAILRFVTGNTFPCGHGLHSRKTPKQKISTTTIRIRKTTIKNRIPSAFLHNHDKTMFALTLFSHPYQELCLSTRSLLSTTTRRCRETIASSRILNHATVKSPTINLFFFLNFPLPLSSIRFFLLWNLSSIDNTGAIGFSRLSLPLSTTCPTTTDSILKIHYRRRHTRQTLL